MNYHFSKPSLLLSPYVKQYWGLESCVPDGGEHIQRIVPNGLMELVFYLGDKPRSQSESKPIAENTIVTGQLKEHYDLLVEGTMNLFSVTFQPQGAMMFFNIPISEFSNQNIPLRYFFKQKVDAVEDQLYETTCFQEKVIIIENFLFDLLRRNYKNHEVARISKIISCINSSKGILNIADLSDKACLSRKQFERTFTRCIGTTPGNFLRVVRFQHAIFTRQRKPTIPLASLAGECGFYDQSHFVSEFKTLSGLTPGKFFSGCESYSDYFS